MDARDATANNADLWAHYLRQQWSQLFDPLGLTDGATAEAAARTLADVAAANVASLLAILVAPQIGRMYRANAPGVAGALQEASPEHVEIPAAYAAAPRAPAPDLTQREEWVVSSAAPQPVGAR
jgi:hypothetical protein